MHCDANKILPGCALCAHIQGRHVATHIIIIHTFCRMCARLTVVYRVVEDSGCYVYHTLHTVRVIYASLI